jgi:hypothetical protein
MANNNDSKRLTKYFLERAKLNIDMNKCSGRDVLERFKEAANVAQPNMFSNLLYQPVCR